jgi:hypothetical protein
MFCISRDSHEIEYRDQVTNIMKTYFPDDFVKRFPGKKAIRQNRTAQSSVGPFHELHSDGHEKTSSSALKIGNSLGFSIYGYKDKWSSDILSLKVVPESRTAAIGGHLLLDFINEHNCRLFFILDIKIIDSNYQCNVAGIPLQLTTDKGSEIGYQHAFMVTLRYVHQMYICKA